MTYQIEGEPSPTDGSKDQINCGPGIDTAYYNPSADGDVIINCELTNPDAP